MQASPLAPARRFLVLGAPFRSSRKNGPGRFSGTCSGDAAGPSRLYVVEVEQRAKGSCCQASPGKKNVPLGTSCQELPVRSKACFSLWKPCLGAAARGFQQPSAVEIRSPAHPRRGRARPTTRYGGPSGCQLNKEFLRRKPKRLAPPSSPESTSPSDLARGPPPVPNCRRALRDDSEPARLVAIVPTRVGVGGHVSQDDCRRRRR